ncbi:hypothetical protein PR048_006584 [Dryococelus australis]|uniref:Retrotransposon gag domain-containing protein n=1 Tax=Dryococelus australis TaxID=614101 RepID=A0ABQ9IBG8_9NEOP|nr:hypothetical protein PR048_006584 [Dryococelus australis]
MTAKICVTSYAPMRMQTAGVPYQDLHKENVSLQKQLQTQTEISTPSRNESFLQPPVSIRNFLLIPHIPMCYDHTDDNTDQETLSTAKLCISRKALEFILSDTACKEVCSYRALETCFSERFKLKHTSHVYRKQLRKICMRDEQGVEEFADRVHKINFNTLVLGIDETANVAIR